ncbi:MAG TPA: hypothetical protein VM598_14620 [Bdellovibrionota bacterium]|nr:hypothetical protein [Bdellovibrionota bacterium]
MEQTEQPLNWPRAMAAGAAAAALMMAFVDSFYMMRLTEFTYETYLGSLILGASYGHHLWTVGFFANLLLGSVLGIVYAFCFEDVFRSSSAKNGAILGLGHAVLAGVALFPFFNAVREFMGIARFSEFGFFGEGLDPVTPILILFSHLIFGATIGTFYGPVGRQRVRARDFEPGQSLPQGHPDAITSAEDAEDRVAV